MRKLVLEEWISLDGYAADAHGRLDFFAPHVATSYQDAGRMQFRRSIDTILMGADTYRQFAALWPHRTADTNILADQMNTAKKVVLSRSLTGAPWGQWPPADIISGDAVAQVSALKEMPGGNMVVWGSISVAQQLMQAALFDEYYIHICPILTGGGRRLFIDGQPPLSLTLARQWQYGPGISCMCFHKQ